MNKVIKRSTSLFCVFVVAATAISVYGEEVATPTTHFHFRISGGFEGLPRDKIEELNSKATSYTGTNVNYLRAFQLRNSEYWFDYPMVQVGEIPISGTVSQTLKMMYKSKMQNLIDRLPETVPRKGLYEGLKSMTIDKELGAVKFQFNRDIPGSRPHLTEVYMFPGNKSVVQFQLITYVDEYEKYHPIFRSLLESFKFESRFGPVSAIEGWVNWVSLSKTRKWYTVFFFLLLFFSVSGFVNLKRKEKQRKRLGYSIDFENQRRV